MFYFGGRSLLEPSERGGRRAHGEGSLPLFSVSCISLVSNSILITARISNALIGAHYARAYARLRATTRPCIPRARMRVMRRRPRASRLLTSPPASPASPASRAAAPL